MIPRQRRPRVVLLSLDGFNHGAVSRRLTPSLWELRASGGMALEGGYCDLPAVTYVSHATLATGTFPATHGLTSNLAAAPRFGVCPGWAGEAQVRTMTIFDALRGAGMPIGAVCGDQHLVGIMGLAGHRNVWPCGGVLPAETAVCPSGYATNDGVRGPLLEAVEREELRVVFGHLNETDTWGHLCGPDHPDTRRAYSVADAIVGEVADRLRSAWDRTVLIVLSDHGMEEARCAALALVRRGVSVLAAGAVLRSAPGVTGWREIRPGVLLVAAHPGVRFASNPDKAVRGVHGGSGSTTTLALVTGGHPAVRRIADAIAVRPPHLADWAPTIAALLGVPFPSAEGRNLPA
jgi:arylsulfatase A-like enzyme